MAINLQMVFSEITDQAIIELQSQIDDVSKSPDCHQYNGGLSAGREKRPFERGIINVR